MWYRIQHKVMKLYVVVDIRSCVFIYPWDYVKVHGSPIWVQARATISYKLKSN